MNAGSYADYYEVQASSLNYQYQSGLISIMISKPSPIISFNVNSPDYGDPVIISGDITNSAAEFLVLDIVLDEFSIENFDFTPEFDAAIEAKVTAEQNALKAQHDLARVEFEQQQEIEKAKAFAKKSELEAEALSNTASATNLIRKIEAEATLELAKKWNGILPNNWVIGGTVLDKLIDKMSR